MQGHQASMDRKGLSRIALLPSGVQVSAKARCNIGCYRNGSIATMGEERQDIRVFSSELAKVVATGTGGQHGASHIAGRIFHTDDVRFLRKAAHRLDAHVDNAAARNVIDDDRQVDGIDDRFVVCIEAGLGRLIIVGSDHEGGICSGFFCMPREIDRFRRRIRAGARNDRNAPGDCVDRDLHHPLVFGMVERRRFAGCPHGDDSISTLVDMPIDQVAKRLFVDGPVAKWRDQRHNRPAKHCINPYSGLWLGKPSRTIGGAGGRGKWSLILWRRWRKSIRGSSTLGHEATQDVAALMDRVAVKRPSVRRSSFDVVEHRVRCLGRTSWLLVFLSLLALPWILQGEVEAKLGVGDYEVIGDALRAADMDQWQRAERLMSTVDDPLATKLFQWIRLIEDRNDADFDTLATFIIENPDWPRIDELQERAEARLIDSADKALTADLFDLREPLSTRGHIRFAEALFADGEVNEASQHVRRAWVKGDFSKKEETAFLKRHGRNLRPGDHSARLEQLLWDRNWRDAKRMLPRVSKAYAKLAKARIALQTQSPGVDQAINAVPAELAGDPGLLFDRARWRRLKRKHDGAKEILLDPPDRLVRPERWWYERSYHVRRAIEAREFQDAYDLVSRHRQLSGGDYAEAEWLSGWLALRFINRPKTAFRHFVRLYDRVVAPVRQARAAYWAGRSAAALRDEAGAVAWYRRAALHAASFYGQLARVELNGEAVSTVASEPTADERAAFEAKELAALARMLIAVGDQHYLDDVLKELAAKAETATEIGMIADYANAAGRPVLLARLGRTAAFDGKVYEKAAFPIPKIEGLLRPVAEVEPSLLLGVARQESMFRRDAKSPAGARGLLQLIPSTARLVAKRAKQPYDRDRLLADHDYNAALGGHYLELLIERFDGSLPLVLAGYNAGPLRVKRWLEKHGDPREGDRYALIDWIELIPYPETRNYVQRVLEGHEVYKRRLAEADVEMIDYPGINLLHPPPIPVAKPAYEAPDVVVTEADSSASLEVHRPSLKPLNTAVGGPLTPVGKPSFNDAGARNVASEEGESDPVVEVPKL